MSSITYEIGTQKPPAPTAHPKTETCLLVIMFDTTSDIAAMAAQNARRFLLFILVAHFDSYGKMLALTDNNGCLNRSPAKRYLSNVVSTPSKFLNG